MKILCSRAHRSHTAKAVWGAAVQPETGGLLVQEAGHLMAAADVLQGGNALGAFGAGHGTAGGKAAGVGRVNGGGDLAGQGWISRFFLKLGTGIAESSALV